MSSLISLLWLGMADPASAHTIGDLAPYHLAPGDHFFIEIGGGGPSPGDTVVVRFTHVGTATTTDQTAESFTGTEVGVRVPAGAAAGQHDVEVRINGTPNTGSDGRIWVRTLPFSLIRESTGQLPTQPEDNISSFKDSDFGDVDNDGFLDVIEAVSRECYNDGGSTVCGPDNNDRLYINQLGKPTARDCAGTSFYCDETGARYEQTPPGVPANDRTYDADLVDLDLDGDLDLVRIDRKSGGKIRILLNDGSGNFDDRTLDRLPSLADIDAVSGNTAEVDIGDADGDGRPDLLTCSWNGPAQNALLINELDTSGRFELVNDNPCNPAAPGAHALCVVADRTNRGCAFAQLDGVGGLDIIMPSVANEGDVVLLHSGQDGHTPLYTVHTDWVKSSGGGVPTTAKNGDLKVADLDGDLDDDVVISAPQDPDGTARRRILWNDGGTRLVELDDSRYPPSGRDYDVSFGDLDRDGDLDLVFGNRFSAFGPVLINKGGRDATLRFDPTPSNFWLARSPGGVVPAPGSLVFGLSVSPGDYDLDGDLDLLAGGFGRMGLWTSDLYQQPGQARDWVFVLDKTRSMVSASRDFFEPARNVLATFSTQRRDDDAVGFVTFDYTGSDTSNPSAPDNANKAQRVSEVGDQSFFPLADTIRGTALGACSGFCTSIGWAIQTGMDMAADAPVPDPDLPREQVLVLATDGAQNQAPHPDTVIPDLPPHVRLYTIALGTDTDDRMLSALASNGGKFFFAGRSDDYTSVQSVLREVHNDLEGDATGKQPLLPIAQLGWSQALIATLQESPVITRALSLQRVSEAGVAATPAVALPAIVAQPRGDRFHFLVDPADRAVRFSLSWRNPDRTVQLALIDPRGEEVDLVNDPKVRVRRWTRALSATVQDPLSGLWIVERRGGGDLGPTKATGMASSALTVVGRPDFPRFYLDEPLVVNAAVLDAGSPLTGVQGEARCTSPSETVRTVSAQVGSDGRLRFDCGAGAEAGSWKVELTVFGPTSRPFVRTWQEALHVAVPTDEELDLRNAELSLDKNELTAGGSDSATATLRIRQRDGQPLTGATVRFLVLGGETQGTVTDHGDGSYTQKIVAGRAAGTGQVMARVGIERLPVRVPFTILPGKYDPEASGIEVLVGPKALCTNQLGTFAVQVTALDTFGNPISGAEVEIFQTAGRELHWAGPVQALDPGGYERRFEVPRRPGQIRVGATVNGVEAKWEPILDVFDPDSPEGEAMGCTDDPVPPEPSEWGCLHWIVSIVLLLLIVLLLIWWWRRKGGA